MLHFSSLARCSIAALIGVFLASSGADSISAAEQAYEELQFASKLIEDHGKLAILLPPGYDDEANAERRYPVIFFAQSGGGITENFLRLMQAGTLPPMIVVASDIGSGTRENGDTAWSDKGWKSESWLIEELLPHLEKTYRVQEEGPRYVVIGQSKGGGGALHLAIVHPDIFAAAVSLDGAIPMYDDKGSALQTFDELITKNGVESIKEMPILLIAGGWFTNYADEYEKSLPGKGFERVQRLDMQECDHSGACMIDKRGAEIATVFLNGLHREEWRHPAPTITLDGEAVYQLQHIGPVEVTIGPGDSPSRDSAAQTRYTTDGTLPTAETQVGWGPVRVEGDTVIWAQDWIGDRPVSPLTVARVRIYDPIAPARADATGLKQGMTLTWWNRNADPQKDEPAGSKAIEHTSVEAEEGAYPGKAILRFSGYIRIDEPGIYRFDSHDASAMRIGEGQPMGGTRGHYVALEPGLHPVELRASAKGNGKVRLGNRLRWSGPRGSGAVPEEALYRDASEPGRVAPDRQN